MPIEAKLAPRGTRFPTGAVLSPRHKLLAAKAFAPTGPIPEWSAIIPKKLDYWGNNQYGDCVTAEEAFKCAADNPEDFIPTDEVVRWAQSGGFLEGADLAEVLDAMRRKGFTVGANEYQSGEKHGVDYSNPDTLRAAIATGPVKIAIDSSALPSGAGNSQGWYAVGGRQGEYRNTDHCVALCGQGTAGKLFAAMGVPLPSGLTADHPGYLLFTWSTIGFVDHDWIMSTCQEAWVRSPSTIIVGPEPQPVPPDPNPAPTPTPTPTPTPSVWDEIRNLILANLPAILAFAISLLQHFLKRAEEAKVQGQQKPS